MDCQAFDGNAGWAVRQTGSVLAREEVIQRPTGAGSHKPFPPTWFPD